MTSSKAKGKGKGKALARKSLKFVSDESAQRFEKLKSSPLIFERGFIMEKRAWSITYVLQIQALHWETFCHPRTEALLPWVYEFYSNAKELENESVTVRGKLIDISAKSINEVYELEGEENFVNLNHKITTTEIIDMVCTSDEPEWSNTSHTALKSTSLSREAKVWLLFINASIMPTRNLSNVTLDRATLIYHILKGNSFNVGEVISSQLTMKIKEKQARQLWYPVLITELCRRAGVVQGSEDLVTHVGRHITKRVIEVNIKVGSEFEGPTKSPKKRRFTDPTSSSGGKRETVAVPSGDGATLADILDNVEFIKVYLRCQHCYFRSRLDYLQDQQNSLLKKAKLPIPDADFAYQWHFDEHGYLFDKDRYNLDPTDFVAHEQEKELDDDEAADDADDE